MMEKRIPGLFLSLLLCSAVASPVLAQVRQDSSLSGVVRDPSGAVVPGVQVQLASPSLPGGQRETTTDTQGAYRFTSLPPGVYRVTARHGDFQTTTMMDVELPFASDVILDVRLALKSINEDVTVTGAPEIVAASEAEVSARLDQRMIQSLPISRAISQLINLAPGVNASVGFGGTQIANGMIIDGVDLTNPMTGGAGPLLNVNWVQEVQVVSLGAGAEYGNFTGVTANAVLESGSNNFRGLSDYYTIRSGWVGDNRDALPESARAEFAPRFIDRNREFGAQLGGPLRRDRVFFFSGVQVATRADRPAGVSAGLFETSTWRSIAKLTYAAGATVRFEGLFAASDTTSDGVGLSATLPLPSTWNLEAPEKSWGFRTVWTLNPRTLLDLRAGRSAFRETLEPAGGRTASSPRLELTTNVFSGNAPSFSDQRVSRFTGAATLSRHAEGLAGRHDFKFGVEIERSSARTESGYPGQGLYLDFEGVPYYITLSDGYITAPRVQRTSAFAQDSWEIGHRLVLHPGVRISAFRGSVPNRGTVMSLEALSPRLGAAWDILGNHNLVGRFHYGRYHDPLMTFQFDFNDTTNQSPVITALVLAPGRFLEIARQNPNEYETDPDLRQSFVDQFIVGLERELLTNLSVQVQLIRRNFEDFIGFISPNAQYVAVIRPDPGPDGRRPTSDDSTIEVFELLNASTMTRLATNPRDAYRRYSGAQLVVRKRWADNWGFVGSYTWSRTEGSVGNRPLGNTPRSSDLGPSGAFVNPNRAINNDGLSPLDSPHQLKLEGTWRAPWFGGFEVGAVYRMTSGVPWSRTARITGLRQGVETVRVEPRSRRLDTMKPLDLRIRKDVPLGNNKRLGLYVDVFNATNQGTFDSGTVPVREESGATFGTPTRWMEPRTFRAGLRFTF